MIRIYPLNGLLMQTRGDMHAHLRERFHLAEHYGNNLDALWDLLTERADGGYILLEFAERMPGELLLPLAGLFIDLAAKDKRWQFTLTTGRQDCHGCQGEETE